MQTVENKYCSWEDREIIHLQGHLVELKNQKFWEQSEPALGRQLHLAAQHSEHRQKMYVINNYIFKKRAICSNSLHMNIPDMITSRELCKMIAVIQSVR